jgi:hypothetical protein
MSIQTKDQLIAEIELLFADNASKDISALDLRSYLLSNIDSLTVQRRKGVVSADPVVNFTVADVDQNLIHDMVPAPSVVQTLVLPEIVAGMIGIDMVIVCDYTAGQTANIVASGSDVIQGDTFIDSIQILVNARVVDLGKWLIDTQLVNSIDSVSDVLIAESFADQNPVGTDNPLQVEFGPAQGTAADDVQISAAGAVTFNRTGNYLTFLSLYFARTTQNGVAQFAIRGLENGVAQIGNPIGIRSSEPDSTIPIFVTGLVKVPVAGPVVTVECVRDSNGIDNGGLSGIASSVGWGNTPSARIRIVKIQ